MAAKCKVYKKASSNNCLNVYLTHRDFLEDQGRPLVPVAGVVQFSEELLKEDKIFCLVNMTYRYGRESDEAMVHTFKRTVQLINAPINMSSEVKSEEQQVNENHIQGEVCGKGKLAKILHYDEEKEMELTTVIIPERPRREKVIEGNNETSSDKCMDANQTQSNKEDAAVDRQSDKVGCSKEKEADVQSEATTDVPSSKPNEDGSDRKEKEACESVEKNDAPNQEGTCDEKTQKSKETIEEQGQDASQTSDENKQNESETTADNGQNSEGQPQADQQKASDPSENPSASDGTEAKTAASEKDIKTEEETKNDEKSKNEEDKEKEEAKNENTTENKEEIKKEEAKTEGETSENENKGEDCKTDNNASEKKESEEGISCNSEEKQPENTTKEECDGQPDSERVADALNSDMQGASETADKDLNDAKKPDGEAQNSVEVSQEEKQEKVADVDKNLETETDHNTEAETGTANETESLTKKDSDTSRNESEGTEESSQENCERGSSTIPSSTNNTLGKNKKSDAGKESGKSSPSESRSGDQSSIPNSKSSTLKLPSSNSTTSTLKRENNGDARVEDSKSSPVSPSKSNADPERGSEENGEATDVKEWNDAVDEISDALDRKSVQEDPNESVAKLAEHRSRAIDSHPLHDKIILSRRHYLLPVPTRDQLEALTPHRHCTEGENTTSAAVTEEKLSPKPDSAEQAPEQQKESGRSESKENAEEQSSKAKTKTDLNQSKPASDSKNENVGTVCHDVRPLQERLIEKLQSQRETERCVPFSVSVPAAAPNSVALVPGPQQSVREPVGVIYELQVYAAKEAMEEPAKYKSTSFAVRKLQLPPPEMASKAPNNMSSSKTFKCSPGEISLSVSLNKKIYSHLEEIETVVNLDNRSKKTVKTIVCEVVQNVSIDMTNTKFSRVVTTLESRDGCPVLPNYKIERKFSLMPDVRYNKANSGVAILGLLRDADCQLASSTLHLTENSLDRDLGVLVSYSVRVSLTFGSLSALLSVEHPMQLLPSRSEEYNDTTGKTDVLQKLKGIGDTSKICIEEFALLRKLKSLDETNDP